MTYEARIMARVTQELNIQKLVRDQKAFFRSNATLTFEARKTALLNLKAAIVDHEPQFTRALKEDLGKSAFEAYATETGFVLHDITHTLKHLKGWMKTRRTRTPFFLWPGSSRVIHTPLGVNLIIAPFNYPMQLAFAPLVPALAAGNTAVIKTSELAPATSRVTAQVIRDCFPGDHVALVEGAVEETRLLLEQDFDHIFFTGSPRVGKIVMAAAARHLTPVTLELGGKSPCIVHSDARLDMAVRRIVFGKFINAGQTCIAPDYVLVHEAVEKPFLQKIKARIGSVYGEEPLFNPDFGRIINEAHFDRIISLIDPGKVVAGGTHNRSQRYIAPTVMADVGLEDKVMGEEIFGPVLPVMTYQHLDDIRDIMAALPCHPLACYLFSESKAVQKKVFDALPFGGGCINHTLQHVANPFLPFGGMGESGMGRYHGFDGFRQFSHAKGIYQASSRIDLPLIYPPYKGKLRWVKKLLN